MKNLKELANIINTFVISFIHVILFMAGVTVITTAMFLLTTIGGLFTAGAFLILIAFMLSGNKDKK